MKRTPWQLFVPWLAGAEVESEVISTPSNSDVSGNRICESF
jgi:hypothetical protein